MKVEEWLDTKLGQDIWNNKYRFNDETFDEWLDRVSDGNNEVKQLIIDKKFLFGGRTLTNYNTNKKGASTSNCYSSGYAPDDLEGLLELNKNIGLTYKSQGGQGISLSKIRPKGCKLSSSYETDGIVPFMTIFNTTTASVSQGGSRKGALMMSLDTWHKEAPTFIRIKSQTGSIEKANLSLEIDDEFMECIKKDYNTGKETVINRVFIYETGSIEYEVIPIKLYKIFCRTSHEWAEPGVIFTNRFRNYNLMEFDDDYEIVTGNPCGEQPLPKNGACNLGSINLSEFVINPYTENAKFDFKSFDEAVQISIKSLDKVIDYGYKYHALQSQRDMSYNYRNIGLGIMGLGSMFFKMRLIYGDKESISLIDKIMNNMFRSAVFSSNKLAKEKGTFPKYKDVIFDSMIIKKHFSISEIYNLRIDGLRNCSLLSVAPSGSIATMFNITTGGESAFRISYKRKTESLHKNTDVYYDVYVKEAEEYKKLFKTDTLPQYFISSESIKYEDRINIQSIIQNHVDTAISSTINLPKETTIEDIEKLYMLAWKKGLKGVTIYRDGCSRGAILTDNKKETKEVNKKIELPRGMVVDVDDSLIGKKRKTIGGCGSIHVEAFFSPETGDMMEVFLSKGSTGGCNSFMVGLSRMISLCLRSGTPIEAIVDQLNSVLSCPSYAVRNATRHDSSKGKCCPDAIGNTLLEMQHEMWEELDGDIPIKVYNKSKKEEKIFVKEINKCPECGETLIQEGGCVSCSSCGWSKCD